MRVVFVCRGAAETARVRDAIAAAARARGRSAPGAVEGWALVGEPAYLRERVAEYRERLGMTHLIVARLGVEGLEPERVETSVASAAGMLCG